MGATLLDGVVLEKHAMVAAGALVRQNTRIPSGEVLQSFYISLSNCYFLKLIVLVIGKAALLYLGQEKIGFLHNLF